MEYYRGLLFLTTNRIDDFDNAFHNRIHVTIKYESLTTESRTNIWKSLLRKLIDSVDLDSSWSEEAVAILGQLDINGRDVRNLIRTAYGFIKPPHQVSISILTPIMILETMLTLNPKSPKRKK